MRKRRQRKCRAVRLRRVLPEHARIFYQLSWNLGFRLPDAERVVGDLPETVDVQSGVRTGLQALAGGF